MMLGGHMMLGWSHDVEVVGGHMMWRWSVVT